MKCPRCTKEHGGPRSLDQLRAEGCRVVARSMEMPPSKASEYLRSQWMGGALEINGYCGGCVVNEIAATSIAVTTTVRDTEQAMEAASAPAGLRLVKVGNGC